MGHRSYRIHHQKSLNFIYPFKLYTNFTNKNVSWLHFSWATQYIKKEYGFPCNSHRHFSIIKGIFIYRGVKFSNITFSLLYVQLQVLIIIIMSGTVEVT